MAQITLNSSGVASNGSLLLQSNGTTTAITIDTAQNVGIGRTPSAWDTNRRVFQIGGSAALWTSTSGNGTLFLTNNIYFDGTSFRYLNTGAAGYYAQITDGSHSWERAASGTAGNVASFTSGMTLDASGNLLVGTTTSALTSSGRGVLEINGASSAVSALKVGNAVKAEFFTDGTDLYILNDVNGAMRLYTNSIERAKIDSSGNFQVISGQANLVGGLAVGSSSLQGSVFYLASVVLSAGAGTYPLKWNSSTGIVTYDTSSRLVKENIEDSPYGLTEVLQLKSRKYHRTDDQRDEIGLVADEVQTVMPEFVPLVAKSIFTKDEADTELIAGGVNYDKLTSVLVKAIQEQQAIIQTLTDRITALEQA